MEGRQLSEWTLVRRRGWEQMGDGGECWGWGGLGFKLGLDSVTEESVWAKLTAQVGDLLWTHPRLVMETRKAHR